MSASFRVYIDESGDDGFVFKPDGGSSRWFVLSAVVIRKHRDLELVRTLGDVRHTLGRPKNHPLHFVDLKHEQRKPYVAALSNAPVRTVSVIAHKPSCTTPQNFRHEKHLFYRYMTRLLLERVSWLCRDQRKSDGGDGTAEITFSNRSSMSYDAIREYWKRLELDRDVRIDWSVVRPDNVVAIAHEKLAGLQAADAVASSTYMAINLNRYGDTEPAYASTLLPICYRHENTLHGYGLKWWPGEFAQMKSANPHLAKLADWK